MNPQAKKKARDKVARDLEEFLQGGGQIQLIPQGVSGEKKKKKNAFQVARERQRKEQQEKKRGQNGRYN